MKEVTENKISAGKHPMRLAATVLLYIIYKNW
jgi:hypothetical protein